MAGELAPMPSPSRPSSEDADERAGIEAFVGTAQVPLPTPVRIPRPPVGVAAAPTSRVVPVEPALPVPGTALVLPTTTPGIAWSTSGPPARVISGPPARTSAVAARLPFPGVVTARPMAAPSATTDTPAWPLKGLVVGMAVIVLVLGLGVTGYLWALPVYHQTHAALIVPNQVLGLPKVTEPAAYAPADPVVTAVERSGVGTPVVVIYRAVDDPTHRVVFAGGTRPVWVGVGDRLDVAFRRLTADLALTRPRSVAPGPLGGVARCAAGHTGAVRVTVCGWQDHGTIGLLSFSNRTPEEGGVLLRAIRPALQHRTG
jgi:hypothetical protein